MADNHIKFPTPEEGETENNNIRLAPETSKPKPSEVFPDLHNEKLIDAMNALKANENKDTQTALIEQVIGARFFAPVEVIDADGKPIQGSGKLAVPKDAKFNFKLIQNAKGEQYFAVFTDIGQYLKWNSTQKVNTIVVVFPQIAQLAQQKSDVISGFVINPMGHNIVFSQDAISNLLDAMKAVAEKQKEAASQQQVKLMFGKPTNIPVPQEARQDTRGQGSVFLHDEAGRTGILSVDAGNRCRQGDLSGYRQLSLRVGKDVPYKIPDYGGTCKIAVR